MAPEYALWGYLSDKADVYSFGVVALEIVSGKNNNNYMPSNNCICLLDWVFKNFPFLLLLLFPVFFPLHPHPQDFSYFCIMKNITLL